MWSYDRSATEFSFLRDITDAADNTVYSQADNQVPKERVEGNAPVAEGTVTLSGSSATVSTGVTAAGAKLDAYLDPSGGGANTATVDVSHSIQWNNSAGEYELVIEENTTSVGNPDVGYTVTSV